MGSGYAKAVYGFPPIVKEGQIQLGAYYLPTPFLSSHVLVHRVDKSSPVDIRPGTDIDAYISKRP
jgi:hypothetical protein